METTKAHKVMLIDDSETDLFVNKSMIEIHNNKSTICSFSNPQKALHYLQELDERTPNPTDLPEFIFLDINMPIMDAFGFLNEFEMLSDNLKSNTKIILLTSSMNPRDLQKASAYKNVAEYIEKPISQEVIGRLFAS